MKLAFAAGLAFASCLMIADAAAAQGAMAGVRAACQADLQKLCAGVQPGGGRIKQCLKEHKDQVSTGCKSALVEMKANKRAGSGAAAQ
jgi:hypothetical protein